MDAKLLAALAVGVALGAAAAPGDSGDNGQPVDVGDTLDAAVTPSEVDAAEYHRVVSAVRASRPDLVDLLTRDVQPGELVTAEVNLELGARPESVQFVGPAETRFAIDCAGCGLTYEDRADATAIRVVAQNTSPDAVRLTAFVHLVTEP